MKLTTKGAIKSTMDKSTMDQRLNRLYALKQQQLKNHQHKPCSLLYRVLAAEADAIKRAIDKP